MVANANTPQPDWALYRFLIALMGLIVGEVGLLAVLILAEGRAVRAVRAERQTIRVELSAETEKLRSELKTYRAEQKAEAEVTRRYIAEAGERAAVNSIRIDYLEEAVEPSPASSPPSN